MINKGAICQKYFCQIFNYDRTILTQVNTLISSLSCLEARLCNGCFPKPELARMESGLGVASCELRVASQSDPGALLIQIKEAPWDENSIYRCERTCSFH